VASVCSLPTEADVELLDNYTVCDTPADDVEVLRLDIGTGRLCTCMLALYHIVDMLYQRYE
jgi:hypothetical protein